MPDDIELPGVPDSIVRGSASDDELAELLGADLMNQLAAQWRGPEQSRRLFAHWYVDVMKPLGIALDPAFKLFTGAITIDAFVNTLSENMLDTFIEQYPVLQARHQTRIDNGLVP